MSMTWNTCKFPECENWTYRHDVDYCESHRRSISKVSTNEKKQVEKRKAMIEQRKVKNQVKKAVPNKISHKQKGLNAEYKTLADTFKQIHPNCEAKVNEFCTGKTDDVHHSRGRGKYLFDVSSYIAVCRSCHIWIGDNHKEAEAKGLIESRLAVNNPKI